MIALFESLMQADSRSWYDGDRRKLSWGDSERGWSFRSLGEFPYTGRLSPPATSQANHGHRSRTVAYVASDPTSARGDASRSVSDPFDSPHYQKAVPGRTTLDCYAAAASGHHQVSAHSQPRGL